jgi:hypothetical protein
MVEFEELRERLRAVGQRNAAWSGSLEQAYVRLKRERCGRWRKPSPEQHEAIAAEARREAGQGFERELAAFFDELCDAYLAEPLPQNRAKLRADVGNDPPLHAALWTYAAASAELVRGEADQQRLDRALAALSLDDLRTDVEQVDSLLARLWIQAVRARLDPKAAFARVAAISNPSMGGGGAFFCQQLTGFEESLAYKRDVVPELRRLSA